MGGLAIKALVSPSTVSLYWVIVLCSPSPCFTYISKCVLFMHTSCRATHASFIPHVLI